MKLRSGLLKLFFLSIPFSHFGSPIPLVNISLFILFVYFLISVQFIKFDFAYSKFARPINLLLVLYIILLTVSIVHYEPNTEYSMSILRHFPMYILLLFILSDAISNQLIGFYDISKYFLIGFSVLFFLFILGFDVSEVQGRQSVLGLNPNRLAFYANFAIILSINLLQNKRNRRLKIFLLFAIIIMGIYLNIVTASKGGFVGILLVVLVYYYFKNRSMIGKLANIIKGLMLASILILTFLSNDVLYDRIFETDTKYMDIRSVIWENALEIVSENILFGVGVFEYEVEFIDIMGKYHATHNEFISILVYTGIVGLLIFIAFLWELFKRANFVSKYENMPMFLSLLALIAFTLFKAGGSFVALYTWVIFSILLTSPMISYSKINS